MGVTSPIANTPRRRGNKANSGSREALLQAVGVRSVAATSEDCAVAAWIETPVGPLLGITTKQGLCFLEFTERSALTAQVTSLRRHFPQPVVLGEHRYLEQSRHELAEYFAGTRRQFAVPLVYPGSPFQAAVWEALGRIPYGTTRTYEEVAAEIGAGRASRAVGRANGQNRLSILLPCHRLVGKNGALCGYGGGLWRKRFLLELEQGQRNHPQTKTNGPRLSSFDV